MEKRNISQKRRRFGIVRYHFEENGIEGVESYQKGTNSSCPLYRVPCEGNDVLQIP